MALVTEKGHVLRALDFYRETDQYIAVSRTQSWPNDAEPPQPRETDQIEDLICMKKVETKLMVVPDARFGTIAYRHKLYRIVPKEEALAEGAKYVYIVAVFDYGDIPDGVYYHQVGLQVGVKRKSNVSESKYLLMPNEIEDMGVTTVIDNIEAVRAREDRRNIFSNILEF